MSKECSSMETDVGLFVNKPGNMCYMDTPIIQGVYTRTYLA